VNNIKYITSFLACIFFASCGQKSDIPKADKFPGFTQIGTEKDTSRLFVDFDTVKRNNNGSVSFKLLLPYDSKTVYF